MSAFEKLQCERDVLKERIKQTNVEIRKVCPHLEVSWLVDPQIVADRECCECGAWLSSHKLGAATKVVR